MAIPKMKIYRLDQNYSPDNDTDLKSINDDEAYPFVEKSLDLNSFEQLVGVTYRDLMAGRSLSGNIRELDMYSEDDGLTQDKKKTEFVTCDGWKKGKNAVKVRISVDGTTFSEILTDSYYRINYSGEDRLYTSSGTVTTDPDQAKAKRRSELLQIEFGELIYSDGVHILEEQSIVKVKIEYSTFTNDIFNHSDGDLSLERGFIYDGTDNGRIGTLSGTGYSYKPDSDGFPLKAEGNMGYKIKVYPCRQKVALMAGSDSLWNADYTISSTGSITIENCQDWILTPTDERRPRVFERENLNGKTVFRELEINTQYSITNIPGDNGRIDLMIQLSTEYYNIAYGSYVFPKELFIRFNEEIDLLEDLFTPDYLDYDSNGLASGDEGILQTTVTNYDTVKRQIFRMAIAESSGYDESRDFQLEGDSSARTIDLSPVYEDGILSTLKLYHKGTLFYSGGTTMVDSPFDVEVSGAIVTITPKNETELPNSFLVSYGETHEMGIGKDASGNNYWACGYRICCYEKTKTAKEFVSSFRNWVSDHLNNNPDIFVGWQEYEGSSQNSLAISYVSGGYSILYREGAVTFTDEITQTTFQDIRNWPPAGASVTAGTTTAALKKYLRQVYAKFAYYDGIFDVTNGLLREFEANPGSYRYMLIDDPTYPNAENKRWIIRNDNKMPTTFFYHNSYLPTPNYVETGNCELWTPFSMNEGEILMMNLSDYRAIAIKDNIGTPGSSEGSGTVEKTFTLVWDRSYTEKTGKVNAYTGSGSLFHVNVKFSRSADSSSWEYGSSELKFGSTVVLPNLNSADFDPAKSIAENITGRKKYTLETDEGVPYNVVFETGENNLLIYAEKK